MDQNKIHIESQRYIYTYQDQWREREEMKQEATRENVNDPLINFVQALNWKRGMDDETIYCREKLYAMQDYIQREKEEREFDDGYGGE